MHPGYAGRMAGPVGDRSARLQAEYVLPLRRPDAGSAPGLAGYLARLSQLLDVTVVDGSDADVFTAHGEAFGHLVRHVRPEPWPGRNGKVRGVVTGIRLARHPLVVLADDDVRYSPAALERVVAGLDDADLVVPQNVFTSWPWHARWDTGRQLVNRAFGGDYPGTLGVRRSFAADGYDGDVLFENLELIRTVARRGGVVRRLDDVFVDREPPTARHFWSQRLRQAYDSFAQPLRLLAELALLPGLALAVRYPRALLPALGLAVAVGEAGRRRAGGRSRFPATAALWVPVWVLERAVCAWLALAARLRGGVRYSDGRLLRAATPRRPRPGC